MARLLNLLIIFCTLLVSCTTIRKAPKGRPYVVKNTIEVKGDKFTQLEKSTITARLKSQLDDSVQVTEKQSFFVFKTISRPPGYNELYAATSASNMEASLFHLGFYNSRVEFDADTNSKNRVKIRYDVYPGNPTRIDTLRFRLSNPALQALADSSKSKSYLQNQTMISKVAVETELNRLVDTFRNHGYYKITSAELKILGDTTIAALTTITDDPFEQLELLAQAQTQRESPTIRLAMVLNVPDDTTKLLPYTINRVTILPDYTPGDEFNDPTMQQRIYNDVVIRYRQHLFSNAFLVRNLHLKSGNIYRQLDYYRTINNYTKAGVWETVNIRIVELPDQPQKIDIIVELMPAKKFGFEASIEASYSANYNASSTLAGNLFGLSGNLSLTNRNVRKEAIKMTTLLRAGIELNNSSRQKDTRLVNSHEFSISNNISFPRLIPPIKIVPQKNIDNAETFVNTYIALNERLDLFSTQTFNLNTGWTIQTKDNYRFTFKPINVEFSYLFNQTDSFTRILDSIPFLRYSYTTALIAGMSFGVTHTYNNPNKKIGSTKERYIRFNLEESGLTWGIVPIVNKYKRKYLKADFEYKYTVSTKNRALVTRLFTGVGIAFGKDTTLPFFKQYFSGGSNGMRGWPIRGIGRGSERLAPYDQNIFNDRTADLQIEANVEYRYVIAHIIPNTLTLRGAVFTDIGNIWNLRNTQPDGSLDSSQFKFKNLYKELGVAVGTGFRLDFNYFVLRFDLGFRVKRPEISHVNDGWKLPSIGFDDALQKIFGRKEESRRWRYENFNFTIGISYPF